ncbi:MAG: DNA primase [Caldisericales bacterium]|nr:DNA primase [Caldisericales bacterium]
MDLDRLVEEISNKLDIVSVVGRYVKLKKAGRNFLGLCPFHAERTPSFTVSPDKQMFYCFGCRTGGNIVTFVSKIEGLEFREALDKLATEAGIDVPEFKKGPDRSPDYELMSATQEFFRENLKHSPLPQDYLQRRGLDHDIISRFQIGFAPTDGKLLPKYLQSKGFDVERAKVLGVLSREELHSYMRARVTFPIVDNRGRFIAFGGRVLDNSEPKYLNSPATPIFEKGKNLFALNVARSHIAKLGRAIVVEGYMDAISMHKAGFPETVASLGTAFTIDQAFMLRKLGADVFLFFDGDSAGEKAAFSAIRICFQAGLVFKIVRQSVGKDPDDLARIGTDAVNSALAEAKDPVDFAIEHLQSQEDDPDSPQVVVRIAKHTLELLESSQDPLLREQYTNHVAKKFGITPSQKAISVTEKNKNKKLNIIDSRLLYENRIIRALLSDEQARSFLLPCLFPDYFIDDSCKKAFCLILENKVTFGKIAWSYILENNEESSSIFSRFAIMDEEQDIQGLIIDVKRDVAAKKQRIIRKEKADSVSLDDLAELARLQKVRHKVQEEQNDKKEQQG